MKKTIIFSLFLFIALAGMSYAQTVANSGFETWASGNAANWTLDTAGGIVDDQEATIIHGGSSSAKLTINTQTQANCDYVSDMITGITATTNYQISVYYYDNDAAGQLTLYVEWYDATSTIISTSWSSLYTADSAAWQQLSFTQIAPANATQAKIGLRGYDVSASWDGDAIMYVDDAAFVSTATPTPIVADILTVKKSDTNGNTENLNKYYTITGTVTSINLDPNALQFYIQDSTGGVMVYKSSSAAWYANKTLAVGVSATITGKVMFYNGMVEVSPDLETNITNNGAGTLPTPQIITIDDLQNITADNQARFNLRGNLVKLMNVYLATGATWPAAGSDSNVNIAIGSAAGTPTGVMRIDKDTNVDEGPQPTGAQNVTGIFTQFDNATAYYESFQISPRAMTDFEAYSAVGEWSLY